MINIKINNTVLDNIDTVIFDKDGTIINSHSYWGKIIELRAINIVKAYNLDNCIINELCEIMGYSTVLRKLKEEGPIALVSRNDVLLIINEYLISNNIRTSISEIDEIFILANEQFIEEMYNCIYVLPCVEKLLYDLKSNNIKVAVVTGDTYENCKKVMDFLDISQYIDLMLGKDSTAHDKITGIPAVEAMQLLGSNPENTICIGDAEMDLLMAKNADCKDCILVSTGQISATTLLKMTNNVISTMGDIIIC